MVNVAVVLETIVSISCKHIEAGTSDEVNDLLKVVNLLMLPSFMMFACDVYDHMCCMSVNLCTNCRLTVRRSLFN